MYLFGITNNLNTHTPPRVGLGNVVKREATCINYIIHIWMKFCHPEFRCVPQLSQYFEPRQMQLHVGWMQSEEYFSNRMGIYIQISSHVTWHPFDQLNYVAKMSFRQQISGSRGG